MFSDVSIVSLQTDSRRITIGRERENRFHSRNITERHKFRSGGFMAWAGIMLDGHTSFHTGSITAARYRDEILYILRSRVSRCYRCWIHIHGTRVLTMRPPLKTSLKLETTSACTDLLCILILILLSIGDICSGATCILSVPIKLICRIKKNSLTGLEFFEQTIHQFFHRKYGKTLCDMRGSQR